MKLKKLFAGIVAVAMMATMAIPGFAAGKASVNDGNKVTEVTLKKVYDVESGTAPADEVTITLAGLNGAPEPTQKVYKAKFNSPVASTAAAADKVANFETITFKDFGFTKPGKYTYTLTETAGNKQGVEYQQTVVYMTVSVTNKIDAQGNIVDVATGEDKFEYVVALRKGSAEGEKIYDSEAFTNEYNAGSMEVTKVVRGDGSDRDKTFYFKATFTKTNGKTVSGITVKAPNATEAPLNLDFGEGDTAEYYFSEGHKQTTTFANIPYDVNVKIEELQGDKGAAVVNNQLGDYTVTYTNENKTFGKGEGKVQGTVATEIENKSIVNVDTGVILDNAPYIALLTIVAAGAVVMIMKKRRNYED